MEIVFYYYGFYMMTTLCLEYFGVDMGDWAIAIEVTFLWDKILKYLIWKGLCVAEILD